MENTDTRKSYGHVLKYTSLFGGVQGLNILVGLIRNKLVALLLGPSGMGLASLFNTALTFISQTTNFGISFSAVRNVAELADSGDDVRIAHFVRTVRAWSVVAAVVGAFVCVMLGPLLSNVVFSWGDHTLHFILLSPAVAMIAVTGGETAILKGTRQLRSMATVQVLTVIASLVISVPIYYFFGVSGIVPVLVLMAFATMLPTLSYSLRLYPLHISKLRFADITAVLVEGRPMVRLGVAFILSSVATSGAEMAIRAFLNYNADLCIVGLYNAAYVLTVSYAGMVFSAMETDYFPRLSAVNHDNAAVNLTVNRQIEVSLLVISPLLTLLAVSLPLLIPLLYSGKFLPMLPVAKLALLGMYFKAMSLPVAYIVLAKGRSAEFLMLEIISAVIFVLLIIGGFTSWGLIGTGVAILLNEFFYAIIVFCYTAARYCYRVSRSVLLYFMMQLPLGIVAFCIILIDSKVAYLIVSALLVTVSTVMSLYILYKKASLWSNIIEKTRRKFLM